MKNSVATFLTLTAVHAKISYYYMAVFCYVCQPCMKEEYIADAASFIARRGAEAVVELRGKKTRVHISLLMVALRSLNGRNIISPLKMIILSKLFTE